MEVNACGLETIAVDELINDPSIDVMLYTGDIVAGVFYVLFEHYCSLYPYLRVSR